MKIPELHGPRWAVCAVHGDPVPLRISHEGSPAWYVRSRHDHSYYAFVAHESGEVPDLEVANVEWDPADLAFQPHPNLSPERLAPQVGLDEAPRDPDAVLLVLDSPSLQRFRLVWESSRWCMALSVTLFAGSPIVFYDGWLGRRGSSEDPLAFCDLSVSPHDTGITFHSRTRGSSDLDNQGRFASAARLAHDLGTIRPIRWTGTVDPVNDEGALELREAQRMGWEPVYAVQRSPVLLGDDHPPDSIYSRVVIPDDAFPLSPENDANQPGSQANLGANSFAALVVDPNPGATFLRSIDDWCLRPSFYLTAHGVRPATNDEMADAKQADRRLRRAGPLPYPDHEAPQFTAGFRRRAIDEQHQDDHPLHVGLQVTDDPIAEELTLALRIMDETTSRRADEYSNTAPRGDGRWSRSLTRGAMLVGDGQAHEAILDRAEVIQSKQEQFRSDLGLTGELRPWAFHSDSQLAIYEHAQAAHGFFLAYQRWGGERLFDIAYDCAMVVAAYTWQQHGRWFAPYRAGLILAGDVPTQEELRDAADADRFRQTDAPLAMELGNPSWVFWCAPAYAVAAPLGVGDDLGHRAAACREWLHTQQPESVTLADFIL